MVATDVAGRGLDIDGIDVVINFDMPSNLDQYTHRIGRTGRCGRRGLAISFINADTEVRVLEQVKLLMTETEQERPEFLDAVIEAAEAARGPAGPCYAFQRGECDDESCRFSHEAREERPQGACYAFQRGECDDEECRFSHDLDAASDNRPRGACYAWKEGSCTRGDNCRFEHVGDTGSADTADVFGNAADMTGFGGGAAIGGNTGGW